MSSAVIPWRGLRSLGWMHDRQRTITFVSSNPLAGIEVVGITVFILADGFPVNFSSNPLAGIEVVGMDA